MAPSATMPLLGPVVTLFVNEIWKPIQKHIGYCLKPATHVDNLVEATDDLINTMGTIEEKIRSGELERKRPTPQAISWIESAQSVKGDSDRIKNDYYARSIHVFGCSWNCILNYSISRAAKKQQKDVDKLKERIPQDDIMFRLLPPVGSELPLPPNIVGQNNYKDKILDYIEQGTASIIGICGMGGAGKTTLLKQLNNIFSRAAETHDFDHVIYVEVGQQQNLATIQHNIAFQLGLTLPQNENTLYISASLYNFLKKKKFLLLIDDLCKTLDLEKVGIPQFGPRHRQMIIMTTREKKVFNGMKGQHDQIVELQRLNSDDSWSLFKANVGAIISTNAQIRGYAKRTVEKCGGLPLALKVVGKAMASRENEREWELAVTLLKKFQFPKNPDACDDLYSILYISYNHLPDERTKQCFILFALASYYNSYGLYSVPYTIEFWMGHGLLDEDDDIGNNYLRGYSVVECLKRACLLEEYPRQKRFLRMHDCIRGLALWIVGDKQRKGGYEKWLVSDHRKLVDPKDWSTAARIYLQGNNNVPDSCSCPRLLTLILERSKIYKVPPGFFGTASSLTYLDLRGTNIQELPSDVGALINLQHLNLSNTQIQSLPIELQLLKNLRYLYLRFTRHLNNIPDGTISALSMLKVLELFCSGSLPKKKTWAHIDELESLTSLRFLGFSVADFDSFRRILNLSRASLRSLEIKAMEGLKCLHASPVESLEGIQICKERAQQLEKLVVSRIRSLEELVIGETNVDSDWHFQSLDELQLVGLPNLKSIIWKGVVPCTFLPGLRELLLYGCHSIKTITWIEQLPCLEEVYLFECSALLELGSDDEEGTVSSSRTSFPRLKFLGLSDLESLWKIGDGTVAFPCLQRLLVYKCPMLTRVPWNIHSGECMPLILGEQGWWDELGWEDTRVKSTLFSFFRKLPASFQGSIDQVFRALWC